MRNDFVLPKKCSKFAHIINLKRLTPMRKIIYFYVSLCFTALAFSSCQLDDEFHRSPQIRTFEMDLEAAKKYMHIDSVTNQYTITMTEEEQQKEGITSKNLTRIIEIISELNQSIDNDVKDGKVVTMYLTTKEFFLAHIITTKKNPSGVEFKDVRTNDIFHPTRGGKVLYGGYFMSGNWESGLRRPIFTTQSSHVTSTLDVDYSRGAWNFYMKCNTGKSAYGDTFSAHGIGRTYGGINRYWWWTSGGHAPFTWNFVLGGSPGGEASGRIIIRES